MPPRTEIVSTVAYLTPTMFPRLITGDVVHLLQPESYEYATPLMRLRQPAIVALAATAGIHPEHVGDILRKAWLDRSFEVPTRTGSCRPILLPVALEAVDRFLEDADKLCRRLFGTESDYVFVSETGRKLHSQPIWAGFQKTAAHCGYQSRLLRRLVEFYDDSFVGESDRAAVAALAGRRVAPDSPRNLPQPFIDKASKDRDRLRDVAERNLKEFTGPPGRLLGAHGRELAKATTTLIVARRRPREPSLAVTTDPTCLQVAAEMAQTSTRLERARVARTHMPRLLAMQEQKLIRRDEIADLLEVKVRTVKCWTGDLRLKTKNEEQIRAADEWRIKLPAMYTAGAKEPLPRFLKRAVAAGYRGTVLTVSNILTATGVEFPQPRKRKSRRRSFSTRKYYPVRRNARKPSPTNI